MSDILDEIVLHKKQEVEALKRAESNNPEKPLTHILENKQPTRSHRFERALKVAGLSVIAEVKRKSPSKGHLAEISDPLELAHKYSKAGAAAISVLTDEKYFGGSCQDLIQIAKGFDSLHPPPILRKDFVVDPYQIAEAKQIGASAVLLIVAVLKDGLKKFLDIAHSIGLDCLVEVHNEEELAIAIEAKASIIGVNNRNLKTFEVDLNNAKKLSGLIPHDVVKIAESGVLTLDDARKVHEWGYHGVLIGEMLVKSKDPKELISQIGNI